MLVLVLVLLLLLLPVLLLPVLLMLPVMRLPVLLLLLLLLLLPIPFGISGDHRKTKKIIESLYKNCTTTIHKLYKTL